jgi:nucleotide-binding universal stress UspA family protein
VFLSLLIVVPIYIIVAFVAIGTVKSGNMSPWDYLAQQKETALVNVARNFFVGGGVLMLAGGLISTLSALNATIYSSSRVAFAMGRDRNFPSFFSKVHDKNHTPHWSILISLVIIVLMSLSLPIEDVASAADIMFLLLFLQVNLAMIRLRKKRTDLARGFKVPLFPFLSILGIALLLFLAIYMFNYSLLAWLVTIVWIAMGLLVYRFYAASREIEHVRKVATLARISKKDYTILVCLSMTDDIRSMSDIAFSIARKHNAVIVYLHVVELSEDTRLRAGMDVGDDVIQLMEKARNLAATEGISSKSIIKISHRISSGIVGTAVEEGCNFIITGRKKSSKFTSRFFASAIDIVLQKTTNEVAILHGEIDRGKIKKILIPYSGDIHTRLAVEISPALKEYFNAAITIAVVFNPDMNFNERRKVLDNIEAVLKENSLQAEVASTTDSDVLGGILKLAGDTDLLVMGGKSGDFIELLFARSLAREITEQVSCPVLWLKEYEERESFVRSLFRNPKIN